MGDVAAILTEALATDLAKEVVPEAAGKAITYVLFADTCMYADTFMHLHTHARTCSRAHSCITHARARSVSTQVRPARFGQV